MARYTPAEWLEVRGEWFRQADELLNVERYLQRVFDADRRVEEAAREVEGESERERGGIGVAK